MTDVEQDQFQTSLPENAVGVLMIIEDSPGSGMVAGAIAIADELPLKSKLEILNIMERTIKSQREKWLTQSADSEENHGEG